MGVFNALVSGSFLPWKRANRETDYETVLSRLEGEINDVQSRLTQIRLRERRASVTLTLQAFLLWAIYTFVCWFFGLLSLRRAHRYDPDAGWKNTRMLGVWVPVVGSPVLIISTRRIVRWWYRRIGAAEDKHLIDLKRQKREKVDEIKRATKYDHLRMLLEKYDEASAKGATPNVDSTPTKGKAGSKSGSPSSSKNASPASSTPQRPGGAAPPVPAPTTPEAQALQAQRMALMRQQGNVIQPPRPFSVAAAPPMPKTWMDKVADAILGADPSATGPEQKYALICARCHAHNGLALKEEFNEVQYVCPHCGHFNSRRPSSAPVGSPFNSNASGAQGGGRARVSDQGVNSAVDTTPSKPSRTERGSSRLKLRADESDADEDEDRPPVATLQEERGAEGNESVSIDSKAEDAREERKKSLRSRKSHSNKTEDGMDLDDD
ncbi:Endoplasmic reticulum junction formation protein lunapark [Pseudozyma hubeiensis]|nr:Endoplasmic reticulum junction formation protein lunapark [Pseudozyma hubeiensis]